jgi:hypothetical protein
MGTLLCSDLYCALCVYWIETAVGVGGGEQGYIYDDMFLSVFVFFTGHG